MKLLKVGFPAAIFNLLIWPFSTFAQTNITFTTLVVFGGTNGNYPVAGLIQASDGNFYGTTSQGSTNNQGSVFMMTPGGVLTTLVAFDDNNGDGSNPEAPLIQGNDGKLYGTTQNGGTNGGGTVFSITTNGTFNRLASFSGFNGDNVTAGLVQGTDGNFYGTTEDGGTNRFGFTGNFGAVFKMAPDGTLTSLYSFGNSVNFNSGLYPVAGLVEGKDGNLYGTTSSTDGQYSNGTIFKINTNGVLNTLFVFNGANGSYPIAPLVLGRNGNFYGMTEAGGTNNMGTVFQFATNGIHGALTSLFSFNGVNGANAYPFVEPTLGALVLATDGNFYGATPKGGASNDGTIFMMTPNGVLTTLYSFIGGTNGANPTGLIQASDGNFYGTTTLTSESGAGGGIGDGTIFRISIPLQPVFQSVTQMNGTLNLFWSTVAGQSYQLQYTTDLTSSNWSNLTNSMIATNGVMSLSDYLGPDSQRFYRVVRLQ